MLSKLSVTLRICEKYNQALIINASLNAQIILSQNVENMTILSMLW